MDGRIVPEDADLIAVVLVVLQNLLEKVNGVFLLEVFVAVLGDKLTVFGADCAHNFDALMMSRCLCDLDVLIQRTPSSSLIVLAAEQALVNLVDVHSLEVSYDELMLHLY